MALSPVPYELFASGPVRGGAYLNDGVHKMSSFEQLAETARDASLFSATGHLILSIPDKGHKERLDKVIGGTILVFDANRQELIYGDNHVIRLSSLNSLPTCPCFLIAYTIAGHQRLEIFRNWWAAFDDTPPPDIIDLNEDEEVFIEQSAMTLLREILNQTQVELLRSEELNWHLQCQIITLRQEIEEYHDVLSEMKDALRAHASEPRVVCKPVGGAIARGKQAITAIEQFEFIYPSWGLSQIDLHFPERAQAKGELAVKLECVENERCLGSWVIPYEDLTTGWQPFVFPTALTSRYYHLCLSISWKTSEGEHPALSLSNQFIAPSGVTSLNIPEELRQFVAVRLWANIPSIVAPVAKYWAGCH
jgi:uncharacterized protein DUF6212